MIPKPHQIAAVIYDFYEVNEIVWNVGSVGVDFVKIAVAHFCNEYSYYSQAEQARSLGIGRGQLRNYLQKPLDPKTKEQILKHFELNDFTLRKYR